MFSFSLFGKKSKPSAPSVTSAPSAPSAPSSTSSTSSSVLSTIAMLSAKEADLEKRNQLLETQSRTASEAALAANRNGQKQKAFMYLQKRKIYEDQIQTNNAMIMKLIVERGALESTHINTGSLDVMKQANRALKQQTTWTPDAVADLTDEARELMDAQKEITTMICEPLTEGATEDELNAELADLEATAIPFVTEPTVPVSLPSFPNVPSHLPVLRNAMGSPNRTEEEELANLVPA